MDELRHAIRSYSVLVLALDTTTRGGSVAVTRDDRRARARRRRRHRARTASACPARSNARSRAAGVAAARRSICSSSPAGPARSPGCASAWPPCRASRWSCETPVVGVSALDALARRRVDRARRCDETCDRAWMDAQRGEVFARAAIARRAESATTPTAIPCGRRLRRAAPPTSIRSALLHRFARDEPVAFVGDGAVRYAALIGGVASARARHRSRRRRSRRRSARLGRRLARAGRGGTAARAAAALRPPPGRRARARASTQRRMTGIVVERLTHAGRSRRACSRSSRRRSTIRRRASGTRASCSVPTSASSSSIRTDQRRASRGSARSGASPIRFTSTTWRFARSCAAAGSGRSLLAARPRRGRAAGRAARDARGAALERGRAAAVRRRRIPRGRRAAPSYYTHPIEDALILCARMRPGRR